MVDEYSIGGPKQRGNLDPARKESRDEAKKYARLK
jgi:hypothetical protein